MFDVGFFELALIFMVALIILGPDKLPSAARTVGRYVGRARRMMAEVKADIKREIDQEELQKIRAIGEDLKAAQREVGDAAKDLAGVAERGLGDDTAPGKARPGPGDQLTAGASSLPETPAAPPSPSESSPQPSSEPSATTPPATGTGEAEPGAERKQ